MVCSGCIHSMGRAVVDGRLTWGKFCAFRAYAHDLPIEPIRGSEFFCPLADGKEIWNG